MQPIIYSSLDAGAPQLSLTAGALNTVLKGCLVTGYGDKPAAGWEVAHEDMATHKLAIRSISPKSIKSVLLLNDSATGAATVTAYNDWDTVLNKGVDEYASGFYRKAWDGSYSATWTILATDTFFYLQVHKQSESYGVVTGFGDAVSFDKTKNFSVLMSSSSSSGYSSDVTGYKSVAVSTKTKGSFPAPLYLSFSDYWGDRANSAVNYNSKITLFTQCVLYLDELTTVTPSVSLPGMLLPYSSYNHSRTEKNIRYLDNQAGFLKPLVGLYQPWHGFIWIHTDDWG